MLFWPNKQTLGDTDLKLGMHCDLTPSTSASSAYTSLWNLSRLTLCLHPCDYLPLQFLKWVLPEQFPISSTIIQAKGITLMHPPATGSQCWSLGLDMARRISLCAACIECQSALFNKIHHSYDPLNTHCSFYMDKMVILTSSGHRGKDVHCCNIPCLFYDLENNINRLLRGRCLFWTHRYVLTDGYKHSFF